MGATASKNQKFSLKRFYKSTKSEIKKVTWPTRSDVWNYTLVVLAMSLVSAVVLGLFDFVFKTVFKVLA